MKRKLEPLQTLILEACNTTCFIKEIKVVVSFNRKDFVLDATSVNKYHLQSKIDELQEDVNKLLSKYFGENRIEAESYEDVFSVVSNIELGCQ